MILQIHHKSCFKSGLLRSVDFVCFVLMYLLFRFSIDGVHLFSLSPLFTTQFCIFVLLFFYVFIFVFVCDYFHCLFCVILSCRLMFYSLLNMHFYFPFLSGVLYFCPISSYAVIFSVTLLLWSRLFCSLFFLSSSHI